MWKAFYLKNWPSPLDKTFALIISANHRRVKAWHGRGFVRTFVQNMHRTRLNDFHSRRWRVWQTEAKQETEVWRCVVAFVRIKTLDIFQQIWELSSRVCGYRSRSGRTWCFPKPNQNIGTEPSRKLNLNKCKVGTYSFKLSVVSAEMFLAIIYSDGWVVDQWFCGGPDSSLNVGPAH